MEYYVPIVRIIDQQTGLRLARESESVEIVDTKYMACENRMPGTWITYQIP